MDDDILAQEESLWAVVDSDGEVVKGGFASEEDARAWMDTAAGKEALAKRGSSGYDVEPQEEIELSAEEMDGGESNKDEDEENVS